VSLWSRVVGVAQPCSNPPEALTDVRRTDARSAEIDRPAGVARCFQVRLYKVEPTKAVFACNLFTKDNVRAALADEVVERGPQVPLIIKPRPFACRAERLARTRSCPYRTIIGPSCSAQGVGPDANAGEEMALSKSSKFIWSDIFDAPIVNHAIGDVTLFD